MPSPGDIKAPNPSSANVPAEGIKPVESPATTVRPEPVEPPSKPLTSQFSVAPKPLLEEPKARPLPFQLPQKPPKLPLESVIHKFEKWAKPLAESGHYAKLVQERVLNQRHLRNSGLNRYLHGKATGGYVEHSLSKSHLRQLLQMRHQMGDKPNARLVIRQECRNLQRSKLEQSKANGALAREMSSGRLNMARARALLKGDSGSRFEEALRKNMGGEKGGEEGGGRPGFKGKSANEFKAFFSRLVNLGSMEQNVTQDSSSVKEGLFRGFYKALAGGEKGLLISDLQIDDQGRSLLEKFARIAIDNPRLAQTLEQLQPGDKLPLEFFKELGPQLEFTKMVHQTQTPTAEMAKTQAENLLNQLKNPMSAASLATLELALSEERTRRARINGGNPQGDEENLYGGSSHFPKPEGQQNPFLEDSPTSKYWTTLIYLLGGSLVALIVYILVRGSTG